VTKQTRELLNIANELHRLASLPSHVWADADYAKQETCAKKLAAIEGNLRVASYEYDELWLWDDPDFAEAQDSSVDHMLTYGELQTRYAEAFGEVRRLREVVAKVRAIVPFHDDVPVFRHKLLAALADVKS
jgi:hypothetical protein